MTVKHLIAAATALLVSAAASAQTTSVFDLTSGPFANAYAITLTGPSSITGDTGSSGISWLGVLLENPAAPYTALDPNPDDGFSFSGLSAGDYKLTFIGNGKGGYGGYFTVTAAPVPEPQSVALMLAGLGLVGAAVARRRRG